MNRVIITILLIIHLPFFIAAQNDETIEIQALKIDTKSNSEIKMFYENFHSWFDSIRSGSVEAKLNEKFMVNNFILFSEDGLIMKDLGFHSADSCKKQILKDLPKVETSKGDSLWIYVTMESHVNKSDLVEILKFLKEYKIQYRFGFEDDFIPKFIKQ